MNDSEISQRFTQSLERIGGFLCLILSFLGFSLHFPAALLALNSVFWFFKPVRYHFPLALFTPTGHRLVPTLRLKLFKEKGRGREESGRIYPEPSTLSMNPLSSGILMLLFTLQCLQLIVVFVFVFVFNKFGPKFKVLSL